MHELRRYQEQAIDDLRAVFAAGVRRVCLVMPTGSGKTMVAAALTRRMVGKGKRVLVLAHRRELIHQAADKLLLAGVGNGIILSGHTPDPDMSVQVASPQTLTARKGGGWPLADVVVVDEAHRQDCREVLDAYPQAWRLGLTATPVRVATARGMGDEYERLVIGCTPQQLLDLPEPALAPIRYLAPTPPDLSALRRRDGDWTASSLAETMDRPRITGDIVEHWVRAGSATTVAFCAGVKAASHMAGAFRLAGIEASCVHGDMDHGSRARMLARHKAGEIKVLTCADLLVEGWDAPEVARIVLARPTGSVTRFLQMVGRGVRPHPGKAALEVFDHVGAIWQHGHPYRTRAWTLDGSGHEASKVGALWRCELCFCVLERAPSRCPFCQAEVTAKARDTVTRIVDGRLEVVSLEQESRNDEEKQRAIDERAQNSRRFRALYAEAMSRGHAKGDAAAFASRHLARFVNMSMDMGWEHFMKTQLGGGA